MSNELRERWGVAELRQRLQALEPGLRLEVVDTIGSTNSALLNSASKAREASASRGETSSFPTALLVAEQQTQGRGRQGRTWHATPGASLTFSLALILAPEDWSGLSLAVGVALADALDPIKPHAAEAAANSPRIGLKWPNDLWLREEAAPGGGRKLGGVLIETASWSADQRARVCVIGVGLNIQPQTLEGVSSGVACVQELQPAATAPAPLEIQTLTPGAAPPARPSAPAPWAAAAIRAPTMITELMALVTAFRGVCRAGVTLQTT